MIQIILIDNGISIGGVSYPNNVLEFGKVKRANIDFVQIVTLEGKLIIEAPFNEFISESNVPYDTVDDVITDLELNNTSGGVSRSFVLIATKNDVDFGDPEEETMIYESGCTAENTIPREVEVQVNNNTDEFNKNRTNATITYTVNTAGDAGDFLKIAEGSLVGNYIGIFESTGGGTTSDAVGIKNEINSGAYNDKFFASNVNNILTIEMIGIFAGRNGNSAIFVDDNTGTVAGTFSNAGAASGGEDSNILITKYGSEILFIQNTDSAISMSGLEFEVNRFTNRKDVNTFLQKRTGDLKITKTIPLKNQYSCTVNVYGIKKS